MQKCNCNQCGAPIEIAEEVNFVTCRSCQTPLKIQRTEYVVYTEIVQNQIISPITQQDNSQNEAKQVRELAQAELQWAYQKLNTLNGEWQNKLLVYEKVAEYKVMEKPKPTDVSHIFFTIMAGAVLSILLGGFLVARGSTFGSTFVFFGIMGLVMSVVQIVAYEERLKYYQKYQKLKREYINEQTAYEQKKAEIEAKIAELEQKIR